MYKRIVYGKQNAAYNYSVFVCDTDADIINLPTNTTAGNSGGDSYNTCAPGSIAKVLQGSKRYMMNNSGEWKEVSQTSGGSGGGNAPSGPVTGVVDDVIDITDNMQVVLVNEDISVPDVPTVPGEQGSGDWELVYEEYELNVPPASDNNPIGTCVSNIDVSKYKEFSIDTLTVPMGNMIMIAFSSNNHMRVVGVIVNQLDQSSIDKICRAHFSDNGKTLISGQVLLDAERYDQYKEGFINNFEDSTMFFLDERVNVFPQIERYIPPEVFALDDGIYITAFADTEFNIRIYGRR